MSFDSRARGPQLSQGSPSPRDVRNQVAGLIQGLVRDPGQAAIPAAAITLEQMAPGTRSESEANEFGLFLSSGLTPGEYRVAVTASGLEKGTGSVALLTGQVAKSQQPPRSRRWPTPWRTSGWRDSRSTAGSRRTSSLWRRRTQPALQAGRRDWMASPRCASRPTSHRPTTTAPQPRFCEP